MMRDYQGEQVTRDTRLANRVVGDLDGFFQALHRWLGDETAALIEEAVKLQAQATDATRPAFEDLLLRLDVCREQLHRNSTRVNRQLRTFDDDGPGPTPLDAFNYLTDELMVVQGLMRRLLNIREIVDAAIADLP